jgi:hypothetical protein
MGTAVASSVVPPWIAEATAALEIRRFGAAMKL